MAPRPQAMSCCPLALCPPVSLAPLLCWVYKPLPPVKLPSSPLPKFLSPSAVLFCRARMTSCKLCMLITHLRVLRFIRCHPLNA